MEKYVKNPTTYVSKQLPVDGEDEQGIQDVIDFIRAAFPNFTVSKDFGNLVIYGIVNQWKVKPGSHVVIGSDESLEVYPDHKFKELFTQQL